MDAAAAAGCDAKLSAAPSSASGRMTFGDESELRVGALRTGGRKGDGDDLMALGDRVGCAGEPSPLTSMARGTNGIGGSFV